ncbi:ABC transporter permease subunit [Microbacterium sp. SYP-A9085]|uniref:amino acid ABC transporter permease n=1 Tax=Microbacterium sp. SYP-A9085 TaxID=2664454 RepID=UPI00129B739A|nr:amino acid ABC transporter permease [Microbacterium sp. SYP-A9085]MRH28437.1 ABC transporter permease subunit [Microbacterium sp. SYP-A9085]
MNFAIAATYLPQMLSALGMSVLIAVVGFIAGSILGVPLAVAKSGRNPVANWASRIYIEIFRNTPLLVQLYLFFFGLGQLGINLDPFTSALLGLTLNNAAYTAEIFRAGLESVPVGLHEAAAVLGLSRWQTLVHVSLKPALRNVLPALTNQFIVLFLFSSVASVISLNELTNEVNQLVSQTQLTIELFAFAAAMYYVVSAILAGASRLAERTLFRW